MQTKLLCETVTDIPYREFNTIYRVMMLRIAAGYSSAELSFVMGYRNAFWEGVEAFGCYNDLCAEDILLLAELFKCEPGLICPPVMAVFERVNNHCPLKIRKRERRVSGFIYHEAVDLTPGNKWPLHFLIREDLPRFARLVHRQQEGEALKVIESLKEQAYFEQPVNLVSLLEKCCELAGLRFNPRYLQKALGVYFSARELRKMQESTQEEYTRKLGNLQKCRPEL